MMPKRILSSDRSVVRIWSLYQWLNWTPRIDLDDTIENLFVFLWRFRFSFFQIWVDRLSERNRQSLLVSRRIRWILLLSSHQKRDRQHLELPFYGVDKSNHHTSLWIDGNVCPQLEMLSNANAQCLVQKVNKGSIRSRRRSAKRARLRKQ